MTRPAILLAHGAGAPSSSAWMVGWQRRLERFGPVTSFDYPYMREGRKRPDRAEKLLAAHREALQLIRHSHSGPVVLAGKSMGGRLACHLALTESVAAVVCLGYPLVSPGQAERVRDEVLVATTTPILFVQGTRDRLCPLDLLERVRARMTAHSALHIVESGDHSLQATKTWLGEAELTQDEVDERATGAIERFLATVVP